MEKINHPEHYKGNKYEAIDIIDDYQLGFNLGNAVKYILRAGKKGDTAEDLKKAKWYIDHEICKLMNEQEERKEQKQEQCKCCLNCEKADRLVVKIGGRYFCVAYGYFDSPADTVCINWRAVEE